MILKRYFIGILIKKFHYFLKNFLNLLLTIFFFFFCYNLKNLFKKKKKMNCITHTSEPAVATCSECGVGLCAKCFKDTTLKAGTKPICSPCAIKLQEAYIDELEQRLGGVLGKKILYAILLVSGLVVFYLRSNEYITSGWWFVLFFFLWGCPGALGYYDWSNRNTSISAQVSDGVFAAQYPWMSLGFKIAGVAIVFVVSSILFPVYFIFYVLFAGNFVKKDIQKAKAFKETLETEELASIEANAQNTHIQN